MESYNWLEVTPSLLRGIEVINSTDNQKFQLILNRIIQCLQQNQTDISPFTDEEMVKLEETLGQSQEEITLLLNTSTLIMLQCVNSVIPPGVLESHLVSKMQCLPEKASIFASSWKTNAKQFINKKKQKSVYSKQLQDASWLVTIECSSSERKETFIPKGILQLKLKENDERARLNLEMEEDQLLYFYNVLEDVQKELDLLH